MFYIYFTFCNKNYSKLAKLFELYKKTGFDENTQLMLAKTPEETKRILWLAGLDFKYDRMIFCQIYLRLTTEIMIPH